MSHIPAPPPKSHAVSSQVLLKRYASGYMPSFPDPRTGRVEWCRTSHRGVQMLDEIHITKKQRPYVFNKRFTIRFNTAFERVVRHCGDPTRDAEKVTWISTGLIEGMIELHRRGFAQSFEAWEGNELVGGGFGVHIGGFVSVDSMFHLTNDASKAAVVQMMLGLREAGFTMVDVNEPSPHLARWGAKWVPAWKFDAMQREAMGRSLPFLDGRKSPPLPMSVRLALAARRTRMAIARRLGMETRWPQTRPVAAPVVVAKAFSANPGEMPLDPRVDIDVLLDPSSVGRAPAMPAAPDARQAAARLSS
jgi:leucyl/phenylalanyl-tRNA--protein transferase